MNKNLVNIENDFFVIDSGNLEQTRTRLYGYVVADNRLIEDADQLGNLPLNGEGAYIHISRAPDQITIRQDFIGSYGLYLFEDGDYFALSNSFLRLVDHIKHTHRITFNRDYANYMIHAELCSASYSETMVNEIRLLDRSAVVEIDIPSRRLSISLIDYRENTVDLVSEEGLNILDSWFNKWTSLIRNLHTDNCDLQIALTGGFDSRMTFNLLLGAGIDMGNVFVHSIHDEIHTHPEDYEIASDIAEHYGFTLNNTSSLSEDAANYTVDDSINLSFYLKLGFHKQMYHQFCRYEKPRHYFGGAGGESVRAYWDMSEEAYMQKALNRCKPFSGETRRALEQSLHNVMDTSFDQIRKKFEGFGRSVAPEDIALHLYRETRCRAHFGKDFIEKYYGGCVKFAPLLDPELHKLTLCDSQCSDRNLLMALMFDRYNPKLLDFRFDSGRKIDEATVAYARSINEKYPFTPAPAAAPECRESRPAVKMPGGENNPPISETDVDNAVEQIFHSSQVRSTFELLYGEKMYNHICNVIRNNAYYVLQDAYTVIGISKILGDVLANENRFAPSVADSFRSLALMNSLSPGKSSSLHSHGYLDNYITSRIDIRHNGSPLNDLELVTNSDENASVSRPQWMAKNGHGYTIESQKGELELVFRCVQAGKLSIAFRSRDVRDKDKNRIPFWIDLHAVTLNGEACIDGILPIWHDKPLTLSWDVEDGDIIRLNLRWEPHDERKYSIPKQPPIPEVKKPEPPAQPAPQPQPQQEEPKRGWKNLLDKFIK